MTSRRHFLRQSGTLLTGAALAPYLSGPAILRRLGTADRLRIGVIGINGMGWSNLKSALKVPGTELAALCDVDQTVLDRRMKELSGMSVDAARIRTFSDYRKMLEGDLVDIVVIGTPDHWHALQMQHAVAAGKDVYVEKPVGNSIGECRLMEAAQKRSGRIVQVGQWQRSQQHFRDAVAFVHSGALGPIRTVKVWCYQGWMKPGAAVPDTAPPPTLDYNAWLGPAPKRPYNPSRLHFNFRWFWDYAGGLMTDWGVHLLDYALLGMKATAPKTVVSLGGPFAYPDRLQETPDTLTALYEFDGFNLVWDSAMGIDNGSYGRDHGIAFIGNHGTLVLNRGGWEVLEEKQSEKRVAVPLNKPTDNGLDKHWENFIAAVRSRKAETLHCPVSDAAHVATVASLGNISFRTGQRVEWDSTRQDFRDKKLSRRFLMPRYHNGYRTT